MALSDYQPKKDRGTRSDITPAQTKRSSTPLTDNRPVQLMIDGYKPGTLRSNYKIMQGLNDKQKELMQQLHDDDNRLYDQDEARKLVGAPPLDDGSSKISAPFPFRYGKSGDDLMETMMNNQGGFVQYPSVLPPLMGMHSQISLVSQSGYDDLQKGSKRNITQTAVMDKVSPNVAAKALKLKDGAWEWLHLVAFSIKETHVSSLSAQSMQLIQRTDQPQQIKENLVLGSAGANTAMLTYETLIKDFMKQRPDWTLDLFVAADVRHAQVQGVTIPVANRIDYHFQFRTDDGEITPPVILAFSPLDPTAPTLTEYAKVVEMLRKFLESHPVKVKGFMGLGTTGFFPVQHKLAPQSASSLKNDAPVQKKENQTGLPDQLKSGIENLSGISMDDVKVHYNSSRPAQLNAHAYAQGTSIHLAPQQEKHLAHEAWHVVQQKQGRVQPTTRSGNTPVNNDPQLESEADNMGSKALQLKANEVRPLAVANNTASTFQLIKVTVADYGKKYKVNYKGGTVTGVLKEIRGGGWYVFTTGGSDINVHGSDNILSEAKDGDLMLPEDDNEVNVDKFADDNGVTRQEALMGVGRSFRKKPRTIRVHYPFGSKTIAKGNEAFEDPHETKKGPQAMVSYRKGDYGKHKKVGKDYDEWADDLSGSESESDKQDFASDVHKYLSSVNDKIDFSSLTPRQRASLGGILTATQISDMLRTDAASDVTPMEFTQQLDERAQGNTSMHNIFGDKSKSTFLPARSEGSGLQRERLRYIEEIEAALALRQNNCLINAISRANNGHNATLEELVMIRSQLNNVGQMMVANNHTLAVIRAALGIGEDIVVRYRLGSGGMNERFGTHGGAAIEIYHTGGAHFEPNCPDPKNYDMSVV